MSRPLPVACRSCSAERIAIGPNTPPTMSPKGIPILIPRWPRSPLTDSAPVIACVTMSKDGLSRSGPVRPNPLIAQ